MEAVKQQVEMVLVRHPLLLFPFFQVAIVPIEFEDAAENAPLMDQRQQFVHLTSGQACVAQVQFLQLRSAK